MKQWLYNVVIKCIRTMAQAAVGLIGGSAVVLSDVSWTMVLSGTIMAGVVCLLMNIEQLPEKEETSEQ